MITIIRLAGQILAALRSTSDQQATLSSQIEALRTLLVKQEQQLQQITATLKKIEAAVEAEAGPAVSLHLALGKPQPQ
jgi:hypothetical protein